jgi:hypothetical protein
MRIGRPKTTISPPLDALKDPVERNHSNILSMGLPGKIKG